MAFRTLRSFSEGPAQVCSPFSGAHLRRWSVAKLRWAGFRRSGKVERSCTVCALSSDGAGGYDYDLFTIGAGSGGVRASRQSADRGARVAICELPYAYKSSDTTGGVGGTCVLRGCVPKKLMVYGSEFAEEFKDSAGFGWQMGGSPAHNWQTLLQNKRKELDRLNAVYLKLLKQSDVTLIEGRGRIVDPHTVEVNDQRYTAKHILIATGARPTKLNIPGAEHTITSDDALELSERPKNIVILGAGYIAVEFAGIFNSFGAKTHLVYRAEYPLRGFDEEVRRFASEQYATQGVKLHPGCSPVDIVKNPNGLFTVNLKKTDGGMTTIDGADVVFMATGRAPNTKGLGLEELGVELSRKGAVVVDEYSQTSLPSIWAIGDVTDRIALTPVAIMEGMALSKTLFADQPTKPDHKNVATAVFSQPPIATVGITEETAVDTLGDIDVYTSSFRPMKGTLSGNEGRAFMKIIVDAATDKVVGVHIVGPEGAEIMQGIAVAMKLGVTKAALDSVVGIHPTAAEELVTMRQKTRQIKGKVPVAS